MIENTSSIVNNFSSVPQYLKEIQHWILHKEKKPCDENGIPLKRWNELENLRTFEEACEKLKNGKVSGIGLYLDGSEDLTCIDLDHCIDENGELDPRSKYIIDLFPSTFIEESPSGKGLHVWVRGKWTRANTFKYEDYKVEVYSDNRYMTVTGISWNNSNDTIVEGQNGLDRLLEISKESEREIKNDCTLGKQESGKNGVDYELISTACFLILCGDYDSWIKVCAALHFEYSGSEEGFQLFHEVSKINDNYKDEKDCRDTWESINDDKGFNNTTAGTIFKLAKESLLTGDINPHFPVDNDSPKKVGKLIWHFYKKPDNASERQKCCANIKQVLGFDPILPDPTTASRKAALQLIRADTIESAPIEWVWPDYLAKGKLHIMAGAPGCGKTTLALSLAAVISAGGSFPGGASVSPSNVIIWSGEDDPADTLKPRLEAMDAVLNRVHFVGDIITEDGAVQFFDPAIHAQNLIDAIDQIGNVTLVIIDPIVNAVSGDSHKNSEVRRALRPLVEMAMEHRIALLGITHYSKGTKGKDPLERVTGSIAFGALPRMVFAVAKMENDSEGRRIFTRAKSNIGPDSGGFYYRVEQRWLPDNRGIEASCIQWGEPAQESAKVLLAMAEGDHVLFKRQRAEQWLKNLLTENGEMDFQEILSLAKLEGISERTLRRAAEKLKVQQEQRGYSKDKRSMWSLIPSGKSLPRPRITVDALFLDSPSPTQAISASAIGKENAPTNIDDVLIQLLELSKKPSDNQFAELFADALEEPVTPEELEACAAPWTSWTDEEILAGFGPIEQAKKPLRGW